MEKCPECQDGEGVEVVRHGMRERSASHPVVKHASRKELHVIGQLNPCQSRHCCKTKSDQMLTGGSTNARAPLEVGGRLEVDMVVRC